AGRPGREAGSRHHSRALASHDAQVTRPGQPDRTQDPPRAGAYRLAPSRPSPRRTLLRGATQSGHPNQRPAIGSNSVTLLRSPAVLVGLMCLAEVLSMQGFGSYAALLPELRAQWGLSYAWAGWVEGAFQAGYLITVPVLVTLTDRADARRIFAGAAVIGGLASLGFAAFAQGLWTACLFRALAGVGLAGTFMPGLRVLSDRIEGSGQSRAVAFYTASFSVGASLSVLITGMLAAHFGWRLAFGMA